MAAPLGEPFDLHCATIPRVASATPVVGADENAAVAGSHPHPPLPDLTVRQLEYLEAITRSPTWAAAAESLGVTPSALSQGIAELERRLGLPLFRPEGRRRVPTELAGPVIDHATRVLAQTRDLTSWATAARAGRAGRVRLGMIDAAAVHHFPEVLRAFRGDHADVELRLEVAPSSALLGGLRRDDLDLAVCVAPDPRPDDLHLTPLVTEHLAVYGPHSPPPRDPARWGPWVLFPTGSHTRALVERSLRELGAPVEVVAESHQPEVLREMVRIGLGWSVLPVAGAERDPHPLVRARRRPLVDRELVAARRVDAIADPAVDALLAVLRAAVHSR